jgi:molybdate transport system substrate-binding protein
VNVLAAASLTEAFTAEQTAVRASAPDIRAVLTFAGSQQLARQIRDGAPADVFAAADSSTMQELVSEGLVDTPRVFARNTLAIAVAPGNPKHIKRLADLERSDVVLVLADPSVPVGKYAREAFSNARLPAPSPHSLELDVKATLAKLTTGEADAVIVYVTDVRAAGNAVEGVAIPAAQNVDATDEIAIVRATKRRPEAQAFVDLVMSAAGQQVLRDRGFLPPR